MATQLTSDRRTDLGAWIRHGVIGGIIGGIVFAMFEMIMALVLDGSNAFFMPLRMIGGIGLGQQALNPNTSLLTAGGAGLAIHMILSMMYGVIVTVVLSLVPQFSSSRTAALVSASVAGSSSGSSTSTCWHRSSAGPGSRITPTSPSTPRRSAAVRKIAKHTSRPVEVASTDRCHFPGLQTHVSHVVDAA